MNPQKKSDNNSIYLSENSFKNLKTDNSELLKNLKKNDKDEGGDRMSSLKKKLKNLTKVVKNLGEETDYWKNKFINN